MLRVLSIISAFAWAGLVAFALLIASEGAGRTPLYWIALIAATAFASAIAITIAPHMLFLRYLMILSLAGDVFFIPCAVLSLGSCINSVPPASILEWLLVLNLGVLIFLSLLWPLQVRHHLNEVTDKRLTRLSKKVILESKRLSGQ
jgi:hypothetical protein